MPAKSKPENKTHSKVVVEISFKYFLSLKTKIKKNNEKKANLCMNVPAIISSPKKPELVKPELFSPIVLKPKKYWKIISNETIIAVKAITTKKYLKSKKLNLFRRYTMNKNKKNLKNNIDFINFSKG